MATDELKTGRSAGNRFTKALRAAGRRVEGLVRNNVIVKNPEFDVEAVKAAAGIERSAHPEAEFHRVSRKEWISERVAKLIGAGRGARSGNDGKEIDSSADKRLAMGRKDNQLAPVEGKHFLDSDPSDAHAATKEQGGTSSARSSVSSLIDAYRTPEVAKQNDGHESATSAATLEARDQAERALEGRPVRPMSVVSPSQIEAAYREMPSQPETAEIIDPKIGGRSLVKPVQVQIKRQLSKDSVESSSDRSVGSSSSDRSDGASIASSTATSRSIHDGAAQEAAAKRGLEPRPHSAGRV